MATICVVLQSGLKYWLNMVITTSIIIYNSPKTKNVHTLEKTYFARSNFRAPVMRENSEFNFRAPLLREN